MFGRVFGPSAQEVSFGYQSKFWEEPFSQVLGLCQNRLRVPSGSRLGFRKGCVGLLLDATWVYLAHLSEQIGGVPKVGGVLFGFHLKHPKRCPQQKTAVLQAVWQKLVSQWPHPKAEPVFILLRGVDISWVSISGLPFWHLRKNLRGDKAGGQIPAPATAEARGESWPLGAPRQAEPFLSGRKWQPFPLP